MNWGENRMRKRKEECGEGEKEEGRKCSVQLEWRNLSWKYNMKAYHSFKGSLELTMYNFVKQFFCLGSLFVSHVDTCPHIHSNRPLPQTEIKGE